jgi:hypothetical protein
MFKATTTFAAALSGKRNANKAEKFVPSSSSTTPLSILNRGGASSCFTRQPACPRPAGLQPAATLERRTGGQVWYVEVALAPDMVVDADESQAAWLVFASNEAQAKAKMRRHLKMECLGISGGPLDFRVVMRPKVVFWTRTSAETVYLLSEAVPASWSDHNQMWQNEMARSGKKKKKKNKIKRVSVFEDEPDMSGSDAEHEEEYESANYSETEGGFIVPDHDSESESESESKSDTRSERSGESAGSGPWVTTFTDEVDSVDSVKKVVSDVDDDDVEVVVRSTLERLILGCIEDVEELKQDAGYPFHYAQGPSKRRKRLRGGEAQELDDSEDCVADIVESAKGKRKRPVVYDSDDDTLA